jgi:hypothetical protein
MIAYPHRHSFGAIVGDAGFHLEVSIPQDVGHLDRVREGKLHQQLLLFAEVEAADRTRFATIRFHGDDFPLGVAQHAVDRQLVAVEVHVPESQIELAVLAVGVEPVFIDAVGPGGQEGNAAESRLRRKLGDGVEWKVQNVLSVDFHLVGVIADGRRD